MKKYILISSILFLLVTGVKAQSSVEYFIDEDPGNGNGTTVASNEDGELTFTASLDNLSAGVHSVSVRVKGALGWGSVASRLFLIQNIAPPTGVTVVEYFIDTDPGVGEASKINLESTGVGEKNFIIDLTDIEEGEHLVAIRTMDNNGLWSFSHIFSVDVYLPEEEEEEETISGLFSRTNKEKSSTIVYPVPANNFVKINSVKSTEKPLKFGIYNSAGQLVKSKILTAADAEKDIFELDISDLTDGVYLLTMEEEGKLKSCNRIIKN